MFIWSNTWLEILCWGILPKVLFLSLKSISKSYLGWIWLSISFLFCILAALIQLSLNTDNSQFYKKNDVEFSKSNKIELYKKNESNLNSKNFDYNTLSNRSEVFTNKKNKRPKIIIKEQFTYKNPNMFYLTDFNQYFINNKHYSHSNDTDDDKSVISNSDQEIDYDSCSDSESGYRSNPIRDRDKKKSNHNNNDKNYK